MYCNENYNKNNGRTKADSLSGLGIRKGSHKAYGSYEKYFKRPMDFFISLTAITFLWPILVVIALLVRKNLGSPVIFSQYRPGLNGKIFKLHKFRSMVDARDHNGNLLSDKERMTEFGKKLRGTSLDELPELFDILIGNLSIVGPRPQLVKDMVFMSEKHQMRHEVMPGLTGLAQINGRNSIDWEEKLDFDVEYCKKITFLGDLKIILKTVSKVLAKEGINEIGQETARDYGDYLLERGSINYKEYIEKQETAKKILGKAI